VIASDLGISDDAVRNRVRNASKLAASVRAAATQRQRRQPGDVTGSTARAMRGDERPR
jgi:hypothetical protein